MLLDYQWIEYVANVFLLNHTLPTSKKERKEKIKPEDLDVQKTEENWMAGW